MKTCMRSALMLSVLALCNASQVLTRLLQGNSDGNSNKANSNGADSGGGNGIIYRDEHDTLQNKGMNPAGHMKGDTGRARPGSNAISYHGGPVMGSTAVNVHYIWYGDWGAADYAGDSVAGTPNSNAPPQSAQFILENLAAHLGPSPWYNIQTTYYSTLTSGVRNAALTNAATFAGSTKYTGTLTGLTSLSDAQIFTIVKETITAFGQAVDPQGVYMVLTAASVTASSGFCTQYCGWHTHGTSSSGADVKYAFIGNAARCPSACSAQATSPNGNIGADAMSSVIAHELVEAGSDPDLNAWYDGSGNENADKCAWTFGTTYLANGAHANMKLGNLDYLIQQNWVQTTQACALSY